MQIMWLLYQDRWSEMQLLQWHVCQTSQNEKYSGASTTLNRRCVFEGCDIDFEWDNNNRKYCSLHRQRWWRKELGKKQRDKVRAERNRHCRECNAPIPWQTLNRCYCSVECKKKFYAKPRLVRRGYAGVCKNWNVNFVASPIKLQQRIRHILGYHPSTVDTVTTLGLELHTLTLERVKNIYNKLVIWYVQTAPRQTWNRITRTQFIAPIVNQSGQILDREVRQWK